MKEWVKIEDRLPDIDDNKQLLVKIDNKLFKGYFYYEIARYTKYGFNYGTRNTQDIISDKLIEWKNL